MRQKLLVFCVLFLAILSNAQTIRYVYATLVNPDSINLVSMKSERTFLDIKNNKSLFISENKLKRDSLLASFRSEMKENYKKEEKDFSKLEGRRPIEPTFFEYFITKSIPEQKVYYYDKVAGKQIYYQEDRPVKWNISSSIEKQNGYSAQKAEANFGGRIWTAWFTKDIPLSDGPYKFSGLPGLIVKLEDDKGDYKFDLVQKIKINNAFEEPISIEAKQSTRINFHGDKAALELELGKNYRMMAGNMRNNGEETMDSNGSGRHGGGMNGGGMRGGGHSGGGMHHGMNGGGQGFPTRTTDTSAFSAKSGMGQNQNPIELN
ncbi:GLPGLI family protein [Chryseobacterium tructae]|uniref:GLPGLI family protein n=1 Tax=Chryseobacterium tructae TaxID=1037380 RepID=A0ABV7XSI2_9FLAO|nr:GLPGLI family protein [Chryseobacterium tructae]MDN3695390.1 GLPGLI family protein [Chryseobacterium tructae]